MFFSSKCYGTVFHGFVLLCYHLKQELLRRFLSFIIKKIKPLSTCFELLMYTSPRVGLVLRKAGIMSATLRFTKTSQDG